MSRSTPTAAPTHTVNRRHRRPSSRTSDVDRRPETLAEFAAQLREHAARAGQSISFMTDVHELANTRAQITLLRARRTLIFEQLKRRYAGGITTTSTGEYVLRMSRPSELVTVRTVESDTVKRAYPTAWQAARVIVPRVAVTTPPDWNSTDGGGAGSPPSHASRSAFRTPRLPAVPRATDTLDRCVAAYRHRAFDRLEELRRDEALLIGGLEDIADKYGWDGLPIVFSDGWKIGLRCRRFDAESLREHEPAIFDELAIDKVRGGSTRLYVARPGDDTESFEDFAE